MAVDEKMLQQLKLDFMKTHSVCPPDLPVPGIDPQGDPFNLHLIDDPKKTMKLVPRPQLELGSFTLTPGGGINVQWLPWLTHSIIGTTLSASPDIFFTAAINGCSVFVTGEPNKPTVYHAGIGTDLKGSYTPDTKDKDKPETKFLEKASSIGDAPLFWRTLLEVKVPGATKDKNYAEVNKTHYIKDGSKGKILGDKATKRAVAFEEAFVKKNKEWPSKSDAMKILMMQAWGSVCGFNSGGWKFYF